MNFSVRKQKSPFSFTISPTLDQLYIYTYKLLNSWDSTSITISPDLNLLYVTNEKANNLHWPSNCVWCFLFSISPPHGSHNAPALFGCLQNTPSSHLWGVNQIYNKLCKYVKYTYMYGQVKRWTKLDAFRAIIKADWPCISDEMSQPLGANQYW